MRILFTIMSLASGGAEILVRNLAATLRRSGHTCHIVVITAAETVGNSGEFEAAFKTWLDERGISFEILSPSNRWDLVRGTRGLRAAVRRFRPDVIHSHTVHSLLLQALGLVRLPSVHTHHNIKLNFPAPLFRVFDRFVGAYVSICGPCEAVLRQNVRRPIVAIPNGVPEQFARGTLRDAPSRDPIILSVGNLTAQKNYPGLAEAAARVVPILAGQGRSIRFEIAGEGIDRAAIEERIRALGLEKSVALLGARSDIAQLMARADLMVNSSHYEGLPIALIEASRSALPVVATDVGGTSEIVHHEESGLLVPPDEPRALADAILRLLDDPGLYSAFSHRALALSERYSLDQCAARHLELYEWARGDLARPDVRP